MHYKVLKMGKINKIETEQIVKDLKNEAKRRGIDFLKFGKSDADNVRTELEKIKKLFKIPYKNQYAHAISYVVDEKYIAMRMETID